MELQHAQPSRNFEGPPSETAEFCVAPYPIKVLKAHPSYAQHRLSVHPAKLAALADLGELAFKYPLIVTREHFIVDGYGRWDLAKRLGRQTVPCVEYDIDEADALRWLIQVNRRSQSLSDFIRIELALDLEKHFREKARSNMQDGGRLKGLSMLTEAGKVNSRAEIARIAGVSVGNVHKVKNILAHACVPIRDAARTGEVSINIADKWSHEPESRQKESLRLFRIERGIRRKARQLVSAELAEFQPLTNDEHIFTFSDLVRLAEKLAVERSIDFGSIQIRILNIPGRNLFASKELIDALTQEPVQ